MIPMAILPILSLAKLKNIDASGLGNDEHKRLYDVCYEHGFFYLSDHDISSDLVRQTVDVSHSFFQLPLEKKKAYGQDKQIIYPKTSRGYVPLYGETLHEDVGPDPKEVFDLGLERPLSDKPFTGPNLMPDDAVSPGFSASHYQLQREIMTKIVPPLLRALAVALNLEADWFAPFFDDPILIHRTIYYPAECGIAGKHTDNGIFTVLIQESLPTPSLRVFTKDAWIDAPCLDDTFVINLGDMLQLWTNGLFVSTPHKVIHTGSSSRISIPFFIYPNIDSIIEPMGTDETLNSTDIMLKNFNSIWVTKSGAGRARELK
ncbi:dioxygenase, isopenicillin N synthase [Leptolyngbya sp. PCC 7375]|nr:dioxygenase, isopenicillin N synthase [Leptolyngbya sp. PCC 7375]